MLIENSLGAYNFNVLREIIEATRILQNNNGIEVGVFDGGTSTFLLNSFSALRLVSVDPYQAYPEYDQARLRQAEELALSRLQPFGARSIRIRESSEIAAASQPDGAFDFVFIDANHGYESVRDDLAVWYPKVRSRGLFCGHDYRWDGVLRAVNEFSARNNMDGVVSPKESDIWWFIKP